MQEPKVLTFDPPVRDADGNVVEAYDRYKREKITVLCNQTGAKVRLPEIHSAMGAVWLEPKECVDLEEIARPSGIEHSGLNTMLQPDSRGYVSFTIHPKHTKPVGKSPNVQSGPTGRQNEFDKALDELIEKDQREDERTSKRGSKRTGDSGSIAQATSLRG